MFARLSKSARRYGGGSRGDTAAALTYYSVMSLFPAILVGASVIGMLDEDATAALLDGIASVAPGASLDIIEDAVARLQMNPAAAGLLAIAGLVAALWAASNYVAAFSRALNAVNGTGETRKWRTVLIVRIVLTLVVGALTMVCGLVAATGASVARAIGDAVGAGGGAVTVWGWVKWPIVIVLVIVIVALLYWLAPAKRTRFGRRAPGAALAVVLWIAASVLFGLYAANFGSYDKTYGALGGVIVFLVWLWITNAALLFGAEFNAVKDPGADAAGTAGGAGGPRRAATRRPWAARAPTRTRRRRGPRGRGRRVSSWRGGRASWRWRD